MASIAVPVLFFRLFTPDSSHLCEDHGPGETGPYRRQRWFPPGCEPRPASSKKPFGISRGADRHSKTAIIVAIADGGYNRTESCVVIGLQRECDVRVSSVHKITLGVKKATLQLDVPPGDLALVG